MRRRLRLSLAISLLIALVSCSKSAVRLPSASPVPIPTERHLRFAAVGDIGDGSANEAAVAAAIAREHSRNRLNMLLLLGDLIYPDGNPAEYQEKYAAPYAPVIEQRIEIRAILGNHDVPTDPDGVMSAFKMPSRYYTFEEGPVQFFALDSSRAVIDASQASWLERKLSGSKASWRVVLLHHPLYSSGVHGSVLPVREALENLLTSHGVQLVLAGHDHDYERTHPIKGVVHITSGGGCCPRPGPSKSNSFTASFQVGLGFVVGDVTNEAMVISRVTVQGKVGDSFTIPPDAERKAA